MKESINDKFEKRLMEETGKLRVGIGGLLLAVAKYF